MKSQVSSPRHLLLLAGLAPPIPISSVPGAHPHLAGWAGTTWHSHRGAGPLTPEHALPAGAALAATWQGQPQASNTSPLPTPGLGALQLRLHPCPVLPCPQYLLEQPANEIPLCFHPSQKQLWEKQQLRQGGR